MPPSNRKTLQIKQFIDLWNSSATFEQACDKIISAKLCDDPRKIQLRASYLRTWWRDVEWPKYLPTKHRAAQKRGVDPEQLKPVKFLYDKTDAYGNKQ